jgi:hypothetical protein
MPLTQVNLGLIDVPQSYGFRNRIINGDMRIAQRATAVNGITGGDYRVADRWNLFQNLGAMNIAQSTTAPAGFNFSLQFTVSTAASQSSSSTSIVTPNQSIEGFNAADLMWGTANAQPVTLSFWVRSSLTGQYGVWVRNAAADRFYTTPITVNAANTWEYKTITIPGDTSGTWVGATNGIGLTVGFCLAAGSSRIGTPNVWGATTAYSSSGQADWQATSNNTFFFTGVQLEAGTTATPFERVEIGESLRRCMRYYSRLVLDVASYAGAGSTVAGQLTFPAPMRATPTYTQLVNNFNYTQVNVATTTSLTLINAQGITLYRAGSALGPAQFSESFQISAEL